MKIETISGSFYEIDEQNKQLRRLHGKTLPTLRVGEDGEWKKYSTISPPEKGKSVIISWDIKEHPHLKELGGVPLTITSAVKEIYTNNIEMN